MRLLALALTAAPMLAFFATVRADGPQSQPAGEPEHIQVQHCLIAYSGTLPGKTVSRTMDEARKLAYEILDRAKKGEDFDALVKKYTDDSHPGLYGMSNKGIAPGPGEYPRTGMVPAFGDVGFKLKVGEVSIADADPGKSPFGFHVIKRVK